MPRYLGQHFLSDTIIIDHIVTTIQDFCTNNSIQLLVEIGPGQGAITKEIMTITPNFLAIEYDTKMITILEKSINRGSNQHLINHDALTFDLINRCKDHDIAKENVLIVGNLPYYITSPLLQRYTGQGYAGGYFMIQKDVADKICTASKKKSYLWRILSTSVDIVYDKTVKASSFSPPPKVQSAMITIIPKEKQTRIQPSLYKMLDILSHAKRKTIGSNLKRHNPDRAALIDPIILQKRLEDCERTDIHTIHTALFSEKD